MQAVRTVRAHRARFPAAASPRRVVATPSSSWARCRCRRTGTALLRRMQKHHVSPLGTNETTALRTPLRPMRSPHVLDFYSTSYRNTALSPTAITVADARSATGRPPATCFAEALEAGSLNAAKTMTTLAFPCAPRRSFRDQTPGLRRPTERHTASRDITCCHFGTAFDAETEEDARHSNRRHVPGAVTKPQRQPRRSAPLSLSSAAFLSSAGMIRRESGRGRCVSLAPSTLGL